MAIQLFMHKGVAISLEYGSQVEAYVVTMKCGARAFKTLIGAQTYIRRQLKIERKTQCLK